MARLTAHLVLAVALLLGCVTAGEVVELPPRAWYDNRCPGLVYGEGNGLTRAATPDWCATCTCGYRPTGGGGDCRQWPNTWCSCIQKNNQKCDTLVTTEWFENGNKVTNTYPLKDNCGAGFTCTDTPTGPWCCPTTPVNPPRNFKSPNRRGPVPKRCSNTVDPPICYT